LGTIKKRSIPFLGPNASYRRQYRGTGFPSDALITRDNQSHVWRPWIGTQVTESESHPGWSRGYTYIDPYTGVKGMTRFENQDDYGGNFTTQKSWVEKPVYPAQQFMDSGWYTPYQFAPYEEREWQFAAILPLRPTEMPFPPDPSSDETELRGYGSTAIARCAPRNNVADLAASLVETYRDGIPHLLGSAVWESKARNFRNLHSSLGDEYLNVQFGWEPFLNDIHDFSHGVTRLNKVYNDFAQGSGKVVRRRYDFPPTTTSTDTKLYASTGPAIIGQRDSSYWYKEMQGGFGAVYRNRQTTVRRWFSGAFTYYVPPMGNSFVEHANRAVETLGLDLNAESLWEMAPWSWAVDWFTNVGDLLHNVNSWSADGLVLKYGYIMEHSVVRDTYTFVGDCRFLPATTFPETVVLVTETKKRRRATPFGFSLSPVLTDRQKAIAAALGLTRLRP
jgi:hypothetical protein